MRILLFVRIAIGGAAMICWMGFIMLGCFGFPALIIGGMYGAGDTASMLGAICYWGALVPLLVFAALAPPLAGLALAVDSEGAYESWRACA